MRHLAHVSDLWDTRGPSAANGTAFEELLFLERAERIIADHDTASPLFLYYATHLLHSPLCVPADYLAKFAFIDNEDRRFVAAMMSLLDDVIGRVVDSLKRRGMWDNCLFVWSSDNGAAIELGTGAKSSYPLRGGCVSGLLQPPAERISILTPTFLLIRYVTNWEGGVRAPGFVAGGALPASVAGSRIDGVGGFLHIADFYATFAEVAGVDPADARAAKAGLPPIDSLSMWPMLSGVNLTSPRTEIMLSPLKGKKKDKAARSAMFGHV